MANYITLIDFGSTFTKGVVVDMDTETIAAQGRVPSTVETDVREGLNALLTHMGEQLSPEAVQNSRKLACSSAAGGLRVVIIGLIPELTLEAGRKAAYNAGAKIVGAFSGQLTPMDIEELLAKKPDLVLLTGGTNGGNKAVLLHNARMLADSDYSSPVIVAGNKEVSYLAVELLKEAGHEALLTENVMPEIGKLNIEPARETIRRVFIRRIVIAKGISAVQEQVNLRMPTPDAVLHGVTCIANGTEEEEGFGELLAVDVGGATTDVYSVGSGAPMQANVNLKNMLPEPYIKRTVEGDLGMRHNAVTILETVGKRHLAELSGLGPDAQDFLETYCRTVMPEFLPADEKHTRADAALAKAAVEVAVERHVGFMEVTYLPGIGETCFQTGKDMRSVKKVIGTGGPIIDAQNKREVLGMAAYSSASPYRLRPMAPAYLCDSRYLLYAIGLLSDEYPSLALHLAEKYMQEI